MAFHSELITSAKNPRIKNLQKLTEKASERKEQNRVVIEGLRECERALESGWELTEIFWNPTELTEEKLNGLLLKSNEKPIINEVSDYIFEKIAYREKGHGILAIAVPHPKTFSDIPVKKDLFVVVLEAVEKPGNLGAILRTCDAAGVDAIIVCDPKTDIYNPNVIRSSTGAIFSVPVIVCENEECLKFIKSEKIISAAASDKASTNYYDCEMKGKFAIVLGTEDKGLSEFWINNCDVQVQIPMKGIVDSLNLSVSAAILIYEAARQRGL